MKKLSNIPSWFNFENYQQANQLDDENFVRRLKVKLEYFRFLQRLMKQSEPDFYQQVLLDHLEREYDWESWKEKVLLEHSKRQRKNTLDSKDLDIFDSDDEAIQLLESLNLLPQNDSGFENEQGIEVSDNYSNEIVKRLSYRDVLQSIFAMNNLLHENRLWQKHVSELGRLDETSLLIENPVFNRVQVDALSGHPKLKKTYLYGKKAALIVDIDRFDDQQILREVKKQLHSIRLEKQVFTKKKAIARSDLLEKIRVYQIIALLDLYTWEKAFEVKFTASCIIKNVFTDHKVTITEKQLYGSVKRCFEKVTDPSFDIYSLLG